MNKQTRYLKTLKEKGLCKMCCIVPVKWEKHLKDEIAKLREEHLKNEKK